MKAPNYKKLFSVSLIIISIMMFVITGIVMSIDSRGVPLSSISIAPVHDWQDIGNSCARLKVSDGWIIVNWRHGGVCHYRSDKW